MNHSIANTTPINTTHPINTTSPTLFDFIGQFQPLFIPSLQEFGSQEFESFIKSINDLNKELNCPKLTHFPKLNQPNFKQKSSQKELNNNQPHKFKGRRYPHVNKPRASKEELKQMAEQMRKLCDKHFHGELDGNDIFTEPSSQSNSPDSSKYDNRQHLSPSIMHSKKPAGRKTKNQADKKRESISLGL